MLSIVQGQQPKTAPVAGKKTPPKKQQQQKPPPHKQKKKKKSNNKNYNIKVKDRLSMAELLFH